MRANTVYLCFPGGLVAEPCPAGGPDHEPQPAGWDRMEWAEEMYGAGWRQTECTGCGLLHQWIAPPGVVRPPWPPRGNGYSDRAPWNQTNPAADEDWSQYFDRMIGTTWSDGMTVHANVTTVDPNPRYL